MKSVRTSSTVDSSAHCKSSMSSIVGASTARARTHVSSASMVAARSFSGDSWGSGARSSSTIPMSRASTPSRSAQPVESSSSTSLSSACPVSSVVAIPLALRTASVNGSSGVLMNASQEHSTTMPPSPMARRRAPRASRDLPTPGSPTIRIGRCDDAAAPAAAAFHAVSVASHARTSWARSASRPTNRDKPGPDHVEA